MIRVAPVGLLVLIRSATQGLVALAGLRTLGFETGRPAGACTAVKPFFQGRLGDVLPPGLLPTGTAVKPSPKSGWGCTPPCFLPACRQGSKAPIGAIPPKPRVRSPERATKPWVAERIKNKEPCKGDPPSGAASCSTILVAHALRVRIAPAGLHAICVAPPRVWSPLQGYAPWALKRVAPLGLAQPLSLSPRSGGEYTPALLPSSWQPLSLPPKRGWGCTPTLLPSSL